MSRDLFGDGSNNNEPSTRYDFCIVLPLEPSENSHGTLSEKSRDYIMQLRRLGFDMLTQYGTEPQKELFILLRLPMKKLISTATKVGLRMELDPLELKVIAASKFFVFIVV